MKNWKVFFTQTVATFVLVAGMSLAALAAMPMDVATETDVATLVNVKGSVQVTAGLQSVGGTAGMKLIIGEHVLALAGSATEIQFDDGCRYTLEEHEDLTITEDSPCCSLDAEEQGATLVRIAGKAMINKDTRYVDAYAGMRAENGERVMALSGSSATLQYDDGCRYILEENELLTIEDDSPCCLVGLIPQQEVAAASTGGSGELALVPPAAAVVVGIVGAMSSGSENVNRRPPPISR